MGLKRVKNVRVCVEVSKTINTGNYNSVRVQYGLSGDAIGDDIESTKRELEETVSSWIDESISEIIGD